MKLPDFNQKIQESIQKKIKPNEHAAYVGCIDNDGNVSVGIQSYPASHPFSNLKGTDNILIFKTKRYQDLPLIIQGPGAGAQVTAAGVFGDLLRLASLFSD